jgi:hypothetical protein
MSAAGEPAVESSEADVAQEADEAEEP